MSLKNLLDLSSSREDLGLKQGLSEERANNQLDKLRNLFAFYREYPDLLVDFMLKDNNPHNFHFYFFLEFYSFV